jgi:ubiquinone/menaquinone biosynthesis C-methylase UbiE
MFYGKYVMGLPDQISPIYNLCNLLVDNLEGGTLGYFVGKYSGMQKVMIHQLHNWTPDTMKYLIKPTSVKIELKIRNLVLMNGAYNNIPLRTDYLDLLVITDLPPTNSLEEALREWHRVVKQDGRLALLIPTTLLTKNEDPLTIGDFVEKHEHERIEKGEPINKEYLQDLLETSFKKIKEKKIVHMTIFLASESQTIA